MTIQEVVDELAALGSTEYIENMSYFGITTQDHSAFRLPFYGRFDRSENGIQLLTPSRDAAARIKLQNTKAARWIAADALRELRSEAVSRLPQSVLICEFFSRE